MRGSRFRWTDGAGAAMGAGHCLGRWGPVPYIRPGAPQPKAMHSCGTPRALQNHMGSATTAGMRKAHVLQDPSTRNPAVPLGTPEDPQSETLTNLVCGGSGK